MEQVAGVILARYLTVIFRLRPKSDDSTWPLHFIIAQDEGGGGPLTLCYSDYGFHKTSGIRFSADFIPTVVHSASVDVLSALPNGLCLAGLYISRLGHRCA